MEASLSRIDKRPFSPKTPRDDWPRMLVVEENELTRRLIAETLAHEAHVITAANGVDGLKLAGTPGLDLIVTGLLLPGLSGVEMIGAIRQRPDLDNLPILIVTALADETMRVRMLREGAQDYIVKPFAPHELRARAVNLANVKRARDVLRAELESQSSDLEALAREMTVVKKRAEDAQRKADAASRAKDEFLAVLSHELRTPLNAIIGWTSLMRRRTDLPVDVQRALDVIDRNATAQTRLVEDLLDVSAMVRGAIRVRLEPVTLRPILAAALDAVRPTCEVKRIAVHWHCDEGELAVLGDGDRLRQVVYNLLTNAIKFTPEGGHIMVRVAAARESISISVEDTGIGIDPAFLPSVFDRFAQGDASGNRSRGLGLGLAIVRHVVELHGGTVSAESEGRGRGATFTVRLPALVQAEPEPQRAAAFVEPVPATPLLGLRVLLIEADAGPRALLTAGLRRHGAIVESAATAGDATGVVDAFQPDLVLGAIGVASEEDHALLRLLQSRGRGVPAIALTSSPTPEVLLRGSSGYWRQLGKSVTLTELVSAISAAASDRPGPEHER